MDNSTNNVSMEDETEVAECDGEPVVTMMDVLKEQQEFEEDANAVLGASDDKNCTFSKGYIKRQAVYACLTCCNDAKFDPTKRAGVCLACSLNCHENHELVELYTKRNFRCDCGNPKFSNHPCQFTTNKNELNEDNKYNQNFSGLYCICHRPYPDPDSSVEDEMIQCIICEDWLHASHLDAVVPSNDQYGEMICKSCMDKNEFLHDYSCYSVNSNLENEEVNIDICENQNETIKTCNGNLSLNKPETHEIIETLTLEPRGDQELNKSELNKIDVDKKTEPEKEVNETEIRDLIEKSSKVHQVEETRDIHTSEVKNESPKINDTGSTKNLNMLEINEDSEMLIIDQKNQGTNESLKRDEVEKVDMVSTNQKNQGTNESLKRDEVEKVDMVSTKEFTQNEPSEKSECVENKPNSNEMITIPNNILPDNDTNEEIMSEIDKILGSPQDIETNPSELEQHNMLETSTTEKEQQNPDASEDEKNEIAVTKQTAENVFDSKVIGENILLNKDTCVESEDIMNKNDCEKTDNEELLTDIAVTDQEQTSDVPSDNKNTRDSEDTLEESLLNENSENSNCKEQNTIQKLDTHIKKNENSNTEESISSAKSNVESLNENNTSTIASIDIKHSSKIEKFVIENDSDTTIPTPKTNDIDSDAKSEMDNIADGSDCKQDTYQRSSEMCSNSQINKNSLYTSEEVIPVITEINSMNENNEAADHTELFNENKRKLPVDKSETQCCNKKLKINHDEKTCQRRKNTKKLFKGATFWPSDFRQKLCTCDECLKMYKELSVLFLIDLEDTVTAYEALGQAKIGGTPTQYEKGLEALSSLDRTLQINALTEYNKLRDKFLDFLKGFKDRKEIVKEEDIKMFFAELKPRKESDGIYFC